MAHCGRGGRRSVGGGSVAGKKGGECANENQPNNKGADQPCLMTEKATNVYNTYAAWAPLHTLLVRVFNINKSIFNWRFIVTLARADIGVNLSARLDY